MGAATGGQLPEAASRFSLAMADPAYQWLSPVARWLLVVPIPVGALCAICFPIAMLAVRDAPRMIPAVFIAFSVVAPLLLFGPLPGAPGIARRALGLRLAKRRALAAATTIDAIDASGLDAAPDGAVVAATGRVRARRQLPHRVGGRACIGIALQCRVPREEIGVSLHIPFDRGGRSTVFRTRWCPALHETLHDFELEMPDGRLVLVRAAEARLLGAPNVDFLGDDIDEHLLIAALELPLGVVESPRSVFVLRDGDEVTLVGFKSAVVDPGSAEGGERNPGIRSAIVSSSSLPALIIPGPCRVSSPPRTRVAFKPIQ